MKSRNALEIRPVCNVTLLDVDEILEILPHRPPFLFVDQVVHLDREQGICVAIKQVRSEDPYLQGHFPGRPMMPGVLILEALAQTASILVHALGYPHKESWLRTFRDAKFRCPVLPSTTLYLHIQRIHLTSSGGHMKGEARIHPSILAAEAEFSFALVEQGS